MNSMSRRQAITVASAGSVGAVAASALAPGIVLAQENKAKSPVKWREAGKKHRSSRTILKAGQADTSKLWNLRPASQVVGDFHILIPVDQPNGGEYFAEEELELPPGATWAQVWLEGWSFSFVDGVDLKERPLAIARAELSTYFDATQGKWMIHVIAVLGDETMSVPYVGEIYGGGLAFS